MRNKIIKHLKQGTLFKILLNKFGALILLRVFKQHHLYNALMYKLQFGFSKSIMNPETFSQKIYHLRDQYKDNGLATKVSDKLAVRDYISASIGGGVLNNLLFTTDDPHNIDYDKLPDRFVIKTNHASGTNIIVKDKSLIDKDEINQKLSQWLKKNYADASGEMQYYKIKPQILIESYLEDEGEEFLIDYKFWCFDGLVSYFQVINRDNVGLKRYCFHNEFKKCDYFTEEGNDYQNIRRPKSLDEMIKYSEALSKGFPFVRVDFYEINGKPIFGEMTLTPTGGNNHYLSQDAQKKLGKLMNLQLITTMKELF